MKPKTLPPERKASALTRIREMPIFRRRVKQSKKHYQRHRRDNRSDGDFLWAA